MTHNIPVHKSSCPASERGEVLYISSTNDTVENMEIEEDVIEEIEQNKSDLNLTAEEVEVL